MSDHIPQELLTDIFSRLPAKSLLRFRCVSKTWHCLISDPSFIALHLETARNGELLFLRYKLEGPRITDERFFLYPDDCLPENPVGVLDCPFKADDYVNIVERSFQFLFPYIHSHSLGFGFDSKTDDYKLVKLVYLADDDFDFTRPPLVEIFSLRSRGWRMVHHDLEFFTTAFSKAVLLNRACHWLAHKPQNGGEVIILFDLGEEVLGEIEVPDCLVNQYSFMDVAVFDGSLLLVPSHKRNGGEHRLSVWIMKEYGVAGSWTKLFNFPYLVWFSRLVAFRQNGKVLLAMGGKLFFYDPNTEELSDTRILAKTYSVYLDTFVDSLVLMDE
uniref:F-box domain-containing protein n=1 Tax=Manihot esculenta TaxID=3983 RepID=A0A2C9VHH3_MANES